MNTKKVLSVAILAALTFFVANTATATPIVTFTSSGTPGNYVLDFSLTNTIDPSYDIGLYLWGVNLPDDVPPTRGFPTGWQIHSTQPWDNSFFGGSSIQYESTWLITTSAYAIMPGETLSGFTVNITTESIPDAVDFFAFGAGDEYNLPDAFFSSGAEESSRFFTGFEVIVGSPVPEPSTFLLLGGGLAGLAFAVRRRKKE